LLYSVCLTTNDKGLISASAPDLPDTLVLDSDRQRVLTKVHLRMEKAVSDLLIAEQPVPIPRSRKALAGLPEYADHDIVRIDINPTHLAAVARHQNRKQTL